MDVDYSFSDERLYVVDIFATIVLYDKLRETSSEWRDRNVSSRRKAFCPSVLAWRALVARAGGWWLVLQHEWLGSLALEHTASRKEHCESGSCTIVCDHCT